MQIITRIIIVNLIFLICSPSLVAQELFSVTEPASSKPAQSLTFRIDNSMMDEINTSRINYHLIPEVMIGISRKLMLSTNVFFSNRTKSFRTEGGSAYLKYRFFSTDAIQKHFRLAAFGRISYNNSDVHQEEISVNGHNTGVEAGVIATQLMNRVAISSSLSYLKATDNGNGNKLIYGVQESKAINYSLSIGRLTFPKVYKSYRQVNYNLMLECLSQVNTGSGNYYFDIAPTLQLIVKSQARLDIGYRKEIAADLLRTAPNGFFVRIEYIFFNAL